MSGSLRPAAPVHYSLIVLQNVWERPAINAPTTLGRGTHEISGSLLLEDPSDLISLRDAGTLVLEDGRELEIIVTRISDPHMPAAFRVSKADNFLS